MAGMLDPYMFGPDYNVMPNSTFPDADVSNADLGDKTPPKSWRRRNAPAWPYHDDPVSSSSGSPPPVPGVLNSSLFEGDYNRYPPGAAGTGSPRPGYPDTSMMGAAVDTPASGGADPLGWGKTVSLEGGVGPGRRSPPPDSTGYGDARGSAREALASDGTGAPKKMGFGDIFNKIGDMLNSRSNTLMSMGAGMLGAPSLGTGLSRGLQGAMQGGQMDIAQNRLTDTAKALVARGMPADLAQAAAGSPDVMKQLLGNLLGTNKSYQHVTIKDAMGGEHGFSFDTTTGKYSPTGPGGPGGGSALDLENVISAAKEHYTTGASTTKLNNDEKSVLSAAQAYMEGGVMPTGNPRNLTIATHAKVVAQRVAAELGEPHLADDALYPARRKMQVDLASSGNSSIGGIISNGKSAFDHLANLGTQFVRLNNAGSASDWTPAFIKQGANWVENTLGTPETKGKLQAVEDNALKYGQESTKFYSGSGGGEGERTMALRTVAGKGTTGTEQAAYLKTERDLMLGRLHEKENQIRDTLGSRYLSNHPVNTPELARTVAKIDNQIRLLRGETEAPRTPAITSPAAPGGPIYKPGTVIKLDKYGNEIKA